MQSELTANIKAETLLSDLIDLLTEVVYYAGFAEHALPCNVALKKALLLEQLLNQQFFKKEQA
jgi:hypothetical protein